MLKSQRDALIEFFKEGPKLSPEDRLILSSTTLKFPDSAIIRVVHFPISDSPYIGDAVNSGDYDYSSDAWAWVLKATPDFGESKYSSPIKEGTLIKLTEFYFSLFENPHFIAFTKNRTNADKIGHEPPRFTNRFFENYATNIFKINPFSKFEIKDYFTITLLGKEVVATYDKKGVERLVEILEKSE